MVPDPYGLSRFKGDHGSRFRVGQDYVAERSLYLCLKFDRNHFVPQGVQT